MTVKKKAASVPPVICPVRTLRPPYQMTCDHDGAEPDAREQAERALERTAAEREPKNVLQFLAWRAASRGLRVRTL
jgi:hypothetical protein